MRNHLLVLFGALVFMLVSWLPCHAQGIDTNSDLSQAYQQLADIGEYGMPYSFQNRHDGNGHGSQEEAVVDIYVNCSTGRDKPGWGLSPEKPFETINYAISRIPFIRKSADFFANIYIAQGTYNEQLKIEFDNIGLYGECRDSTLISGYGLEEWHTILIVNSYNIWLDGLTIDRGSDGGGIQVYRSTAEVWNTTIINNGIGVLAGDSNVTIVDSDVTNNGDGIIVIGAALRFMGNVSISNNTMEGIFILENSNIDIGPPTELIVSENGSFGIAIDSSSKIIFGGHVLISDNTEAGVFSDGSLLGFGFETQIKKNRSGIILGMHGFIDGEGLLVGGSSLIISDNLTTGLTSFGGDIDFSDCDATIVDNPDGDVGLSFGARAVFEGDDIGTLSCDETVLISGDMSCP